MKMVKITVLYHSAKLFFFFFKSF